jgi:hypothetical protein
MTLKNLNITNNNYESNWTNNYDDEIFILGTIKPFSYKAEYTDVETQEVSWCILSESEINLVKSKL